MNYLVPAIGIVIVTTILVMINEFTNTTLVRDYALILIIAGMFLGMGLTKLGDQSKKQNSDDKS